MGAHFINLEPRYTCGSPAAVYDEELARRVAKEEREAYEYALTGAVGPTDCEKARIRGLTLIVFEMRETAKGWKVKDWITGDLWFWPFKATCLKCNAKHVRCERGTLTEHTRAGDLGRCDSRAHVGKRMEEHEWR